VIRALRESKAGEFAHLFLIIQFGLSRKKGNCLAVVSCHVAALMTFPLRGGSDPFMGELTR
jgi:hypothetical protein